MIDALDTPESSTIVRLEYDDESLILRVEFKAGSYNYFDIPPHLYEAMKGASSKGQFLAQNIKGVYRYSRA